MGSKLYVGNLPYTVDDQFLIETFSECGTVKSAKVIMDRDSGRSKGFAFVEMSTSEEAQDVIQQFDGANCDGRALKISEAKPPGPRPERAQGGGLRGGIQRAGAEAASRGGFGQGFGGGSRW